MEDAAGAETAGSGAASGADGAAVSARRRAITVALLLAGANCVFSWLLGLRFLGFTIPAGNISAVGWVHLPLAYLGNFAAVHLILFGVAVGLIAVSRRTARWVPLVWFALAMTPLHVLTYIDGVIYTNYRQHFSGAVLKMLMTPGVGDLFDFSLRDWLKVIFMLSAAAGAEAGAAWGLGRLVDRVPRLALRAGRTATIATAAILGAVLLEKAIYMWADATSRRDVMVNARVIPFYLPATCKRRLRKMGFTVDREHSFSRSLALKYPLKPVRPPEKPRRLNLVWLAVEGWRPDALTPEISPNLSRFAEGCLVGERHYSSGNCTRIGIFGMFYGLDGFYWKPFLAERRGPVLVSLLKEMGYDFLMMGSANFLNPELRLTCFVELPEEKLAYGKALGRRNFQRDLEMTRRFGKFLDERDAKRPFFAFAFMDSTHSPYRFQELPDWKPRFSGYAESVSHERLASDAAERRQALVRYRNSASYVDHLLGKMLDEVRKHGLLEDTVVMISGDHSEEFGENGFFGHNGSFDDWQVKTPLIFYYPGVKPGRITRMTSHVDWVPTVMKLIGVKDDPADYCQGVDILGDVERDYVVGGSYNVAGIIARDGTRLVFPIEGYRMSTLDVYDGRYLEPPDRERLLKLHMPKLKEVYEGAGRFKR